jgi:FKBP-type peptidyl-prolyl cis-trans isomerase FklB
MRQTASNNGILHRIGQSALFIILCSLFISVSACSESDDEAADEYANWQQRNDAFFLTLEDSVRSNGATWVKWKTYTKDAKTEGVNTDYVYARLLEKGFGTGSPIYTDSVRVSYRGRLIPSASYPQGYVFDQTYTGDFDLRTTDVANSRVSTYVDGFATALQHMHLGDRYRVFIPYKLGYNATARTGIPAYSTLIFDVVLIDFVTGSESLVPWSARSGRFANE